MEGGRIGDLSDALILRHMMNICLLKSGIPWSSLAEMSEFEVEALYAIETAIQKRAEIEQINMINMARQV